MSSKFAITTNIKLSTPIQLIEHYAIVGCMGFSM